MPFVRFAAVALCAFLLCACGHSATSIPPVPAVPDAAPGAPVLSPEYLSSTSSRIAVGHVFDNGITTTQIASYPNRYDVVWGSFDPSPWRSADPNAIVSRYYILEEDNVVMSGHNLAWWQANHPDWILYACTPSGTPTHEIAYTPGVGFADVPLDIHNPNVVAYQQRQSLIPYVTTHNYNGIALDEVLLSDVMLGGNPRLGQSIISGYFGCGIWKGSTFVRRYSSRTDPAWPADVVAWVKSLHSILKTDTVIAPKNISLIINHPGGGINTNEATLLANTDVDLNETGYSDYGNYTQAAHANLFLATLNWSIYAQQHGVRVVNVDKYTTTSSISASQADHSIAAYLMGDMGKAALVVAGTSYNVQPYYSQFATSFGAACASYYGGAGYDSVNPQIYYRRYANGMAVVNSGSLPRTSEIAHLPLNHVYHDVMGRTVTNPLVVNSSDGYALTTTAGTGCQ